ncbi:hypothetical protein AC579_4141 [Pseudocercospora musae]|uniref:FAD-binding PCMH-type domain-containing protein n=1 Tax=Pseudocercospora musae TaxID=113226 RepID=A0A139I242_9PEZI|nr:hypothetical protein AC579_4141 [Pseudocercospora musae]
MSDLGLGGLGLGKSLGALGDGLQGVKPVLEDAFVSLGGAVGDLGGLIPAHGPFQQCIVAAFGADTTRYAFPQDLLFGLTDQRPYNLDAAWTPAAIVYPHSAIEVSTSVSCAYEFGIAVQAKSGGHSYRGFGLGGQDGSLVIDLRFLKDFAYDPNTQHVTFGSGSLLMDLDRHLAALERVMAYGVVGDIGTGGHIAIGGLGPLSRLLGLASDQLISMQCVLGDGRIVTASNRENSDLFFAMKGAAWSFAIATQFTMQTSPAPSTVTSYQFNITAGSIGGLADSFKRWQRLVADPALSRYFASTFTLTQDLAIYSGTFFGDVETFNQLNLGLSLFDGIYGISIVSQVVTTVIHELIDVVQDLFGQIPQHFYSKSLKYTQYTLLSDAAVDTLFQYIDQTPKGVLIWFIVWDLNGGAIADIRQDATAYWNRDALFFQQSYVADVLAPITQTSYNFLNGINEVAKRLRPGSDDSAYPGYVDHLLPDPLKAYWGRNVPRLIQIKGEYDPANTFRNPQSIPSPYGGRQQHKHKRETSLHSPRAQVHSHDNNARNSVQVRA